MRKLSILGVCLVLLTSSVRAQSTWKAIVDSSRIVNDQLEITVVYTNGTQSANQTYHFDGSSDIAAALSLAVSQKLSALNAISTFPVPSGAFTPIPVTPPVVDATAVQLEAAITLLQSAQRAVNLGVITTAAPEYQSALAAVKALYQAKYLGLF